MDRPRPGPAGGPGSFRPLKNPAAFLTHLHSDHISDLYNIIGTGLQNGPTVPDRVLQVLGPGDRGALPVNYRGEQIPPEKVVSPANPTPGTRETIELMIKAFATDFNDRVIDSGYPPLHEFVVGRDITLPAELVDAPNRSPHPRMSPVGLFEDDGVKVTATLCSTRRCPRLSPTGSTPRTAR